MARPRKPSHVSTHGPQHFDASFQRHCAPAQTGDMDKLTRIDANNASTEELPTSYGCKSAVFLANVRPEHASTGLITASEAGF